METRFPACYVQLPEYTEHRRAPFYLAAEEYIAQHLPTDNYLFSWQLGPTVVMGRNQVAHQEVDLDFCVQEGIDVVRRKSGGGAIFADGNNIMWSLITGEGAVEPLFIEYAEQVAAALCKLGAQVELSGRNDIILKGGGKICGNAFYHLPERNIVHGTMLYDTTPRLMQGALHPNVSKLQAKGVKSVRSRIALLKDYLPFGVTELRHRLRSLLCDRSVALGDEAVKEIERMEQGYYDPEYLYGQTAASDLTREARIEGCGTLAFHFTLRGTLIEKVSLSGDFFELDNAAECFNRAFAGAAFTPQSLKQAVEEHHPERSIRGLTAEQLTACLTD
ncbi:MAG: lipoate protein ligase C-terminal domain-containing protein [Bacteroidales bacterium]|nr:lipoate protein ligase C-terminal domain-containing protein [Bacteroidales bacterium]